MSNDDCKLNDGFYHVFPIDDLKEHVIEGLGCWCKPEEEEGVVVHNSMDEREAYESGKRKPS